MDSYLYEDAFERNLSKEIREYSKDEVPIDIGTWVSYMPYHSIEQKQLQFEHLLSLPIENSYGPVKFILTKNIETYEKYLEQISKKIRIENTTTVLEKEVFYTSKIEGAKTTRKRTQELHNGSPIKEDNAFSEAMIVGNFRAVKMLNLYGNRFDKDILYKVWKTLTENCRQNEDIQGENEYGDCTPFVTYMMEKMADAYFTAMKTQNEKDSLIKL